MEFDGFSLMRKYGFEFIDNSSLVQNDKNAYIQIVSVKEGWQIVFKDLSNIKNFFEEIDELEKNFSLEELWNHQLEEFVSFEYSLQHNLAIQAKKIERHNGNRKKENKS